MLLTSAAFSHEGKIPAQFTCDGDNRSPEFSWRDAPEQTKSFALTMHDPDAPRSGGFTHWVLYDIPASVAAIEPNMPKRDRVPGIGVHGRNDAGQLGYMGPCPPSGSHRYFIRLYALDTATLGLQPGASLKQVQEAMHGHVLAQTELMGTYAKASKRAA